VALVVIVVFLELNGWRFEATEAQAVEAMVVLADGSLGEAELADWIRQHSTKPRGK
jgi:death-on-curing protein